MITVNMAKAREVWRSKMRITREPLLAALDTQYQRATEIGADTSAIVAHKQALRDVTDDPGIEAAQTIQELQAVWPAVLDQSISEVPLPPVPQIISDRQFFQQAAVLSLITQAEALAAVQTGAIPAMLQTVVDELPDADTRFAATMLLAGATQFERNHPLTVEVGVHLGLTTAQVDDFFIAAAQL